MYQNALRRFYDNRSAVVMLYLARCAADPLPLLPRTSFRRLECRCCRAGRSAGAVPRVALLGAAARARTRPRLARRPRGPRPSPAASPRQPCLLSPHHARSAQYDADQLPEARRTLAKALHLAPTDNNLRFDVAVTLQVGGIRRAGGWVVEGG